MAEVITAAAVRLNAIAGCLRRGRPVTFRELRGATGASPATLKRDLMRMRECYDAVIEYDPHENGYVLKDAGRLLKIADQVRTIAMDVDLILEV